MLRDFLRAGYPSLYVLTQEPHRAEAVLTEQAQGLAETYAWDCLQGITKNNQLVEERTDPVEVLKWLNASKDTMLIAHNMHFFLNVPEVMQAVQNGVYIWKSKGSCLCTVAPYVKVPPELDKFMHVVDFPLPDDALLDKIQSDLAQSVEGLSANPDAIPAARGLTEFEAETAFARSVVVRGKFDPGVISETKAQMIKKSGLMEFYPPVPISAVGGLQLFKNWFHTVAEAFKPGSHLPKIKGVLFVGHPGTGKSLVSKAMASIMGWPLIKLDIAALKDSLVGESERKMRMATRTIDGFGSAIVWLDEIEKVLGGADGSAKTGDTTASMLGHWLTWMQETSTPVIVAATCNKADALPGAFLRRFDELFFVDLPTLHERKEIIEIQNTKWSAQLPVEWAEKTESYTGADLEKLAKQSVFFGAEAALARVVPTHKTMKEEIESLRQWAAPRTQPANTPEVQDPSGRKLRLQ